MAANAVLTDCYDNGRKSSGTLAYEGQGRNPNQNQFVGVDCKTSLHQPLWAVVGLTGELSCQRKRGKGGAGNAGVMVAMRRKTKKEYSLSYHHGACSNHRRAVECLSHWLR
ncbi:hypothetical protein ACSQ67_011734 [Phaseolus vulgaris]